MKKQQQEELPYKPVAMWSVGVPEQKHPSFGAPLLFRHSSLWGSFHAGFQHFRHLHRQKRHRGRTHTIDYPKARQNQVRRSNNDIPNEHRLSK